jgi:hypothetical protein
LEATALETDHLDQRPVPAMAKPYDKIVKLIRGKHIEREREDLDLRGEGRGWHTSAVAVASTSARGLPLP